MLSKESGRRSRCAVDDTGGFCNKLKTDGEHLVNGAETELVRWRAEGLGVLRSACGNRSSGRWARPKGGDESDRVDPNVFLSSVVNSESSGVGKPTSRGWWLRLQTGSL